MAVVQPRRSEREQLRLGVSILGGIVVGGVIAGVAGPIILAILIGAIWGGH